MEKNNTTRKIILGKIALLASLNGRHILLKQLKCEKIMSPFNFQKKKLTAPKLDTAVQSMRQTSKKIYLRTCKHTVSREISASFYQKLLRHDMI